MNLNRRSVIKSAGALGAVLLAPKLPMWALADEVPTVSASGDYIGLSSALLNVDAHVLMPRLMQDDISLADSYYTLSGTAMASGTAQLIKAYKYLVDQGHSPQKTTDLLLRNPANQNQPLISSVGCAARLNMMMWHFGVWYGKTEIDRIPSSVNYIEDSYQQDFVVSSRAYKNAWIWRFAQAHPMGNSHFKFGSWADEPPTLSQYTNPFR